jgi:hypothetical protein
MSFSKLWRRQAGGGHRKRRVQQVQLSNSPAENTLVLNDCDERWRSRGRAERLETAPVCALGPGSSNYDAENRFTIWSAIRFPKIGQLRKFPCFPQGYPVQQAFD